MPNKAQFSQEHQFNNYHKDVIEKWWLNVELGEFVGVNNINISYAYFYQEANSRDLVISPGRCESFLKYKELCYNFSQQGYNIFILDHRGQGTSQRMLVNRHKGYVQHFDHYANDLHTFICTVVNAKAKLRSASKRPYLLAHSMGGAIALRMLELYPGTIQVALLSSPMLAINSGNSPTWLAEFLIKSIQLINKLIDTEPWYFLGQKDYQATPFQHNKLTQSEERYQYFSELYSFQSQIQLGGVTIHWLIEAIKAKKAIFKDIGKIKTPIRVLQASADTVVDNEVQTNFCHKLHQLSTQYCPDSQPLVIDGARHELFFEKDQYREQALSHALSWFDKYS